jgi:hypothetical protein
LALKKIEDLNGQMHWTCRRRSRMMNCWKTFGTFAIVGSENAKLKIKNTILTEKKNNFN